MGSDAKIKEQYKKIEPKLRPLVDAVVKRLKQIFPDAVIEGNVKSIKSVIRKYNTKKYKDMVEFSDLARARLFFPSNYDYDQVLQMLVDELGDSIIKIDWQQSKDYGLKYRGIVHIDFDFGGIKFELQVIPLGFKDYIKPLHKVYELMRDHTDLPKELKEHMVTLHNKIYEAFEKKYL